jgi:hypothetical protein
MSQGAGRNLERQWRADLSKVLDDREKTEASWKVACSRDFVPAAHPGIRRFNAYLTCQNVAGLWLLYGVRP